MGIITMEPLIHVVRPIISVGTFLHLLQSVSVGINPIFWSLFWFFGTRTQFCVEYRPKNGQQHDTASQMPHSGTDGMDANAPVFKQGGGGFHLQHVGYGYLSVYVSICLSVSLLDATLGTQI